MKFTLPDGTPYEMDTDLFQPVEPEACQYKVMGTKVEIQLKKANGISWAALEPAEGLCSWTTFGTTGRTGTVGSKEMVKSEDSPLFAIK